MLGKLEIVLSWPLCVLPPPLVPVVCVPQERPDAILPTMGGQTGLNLAKNLAESGEQQHTAAHSMAQHHTAAHSMAQHGAVRHCMAQQRTAAHSMTQHGAVRHCMALHGTAVAVDLGQHVVAAHSDSTGSSSMTALCGTAQWGRLTWVECRAGHSTQQQG
jgi:hypothetical protein